MHAKKCLAITCVLLFGMTEGIVQGQYQLDNNLEQSSSQINPSDPTTDYGARNNVITGNVSGGKQFRGEVNYGSAGDFRGHAGSDSLFQYRANAAPVASFQKSLAPQSIYRSSRAAILGNVHTLHANSRNLIPSVDTAQNAYRTGQIQPQIPGASQAGLRGARSLNMRTRQRNAGTLRSSPGSSLTVNLRPLFIGGRSTSSAVPKSHAFAPSQIKPDTLLAYPLSTAPKPKPYQPSAVESLLSSQAAYESRPSQEQRVLQVQAKQIATKGSINTRPGQDAFQILRQAKANRQRLAQGLEPLKTGPDATNQLIKPTPTPGSTPAPGSTPGSIPDNTLGSTPGNHLSPGSIPGNTPGNTPFGHTFGSTLGNVRGNTLGNTPDSLGLHGTHASTAPVTQADAFAQVLKAVSQSVTTPQQRQAQRQQEQHRITQTRLIARGAKTASQADTSPKPTGGLFATARPKAKAPVIAPEMPQMSSQTATELQRQWYNTRMLQQGNNDLRHGQYFDAARKFRNVLLSEPGSFEATAGLLHAQIGAGMIRVASLNLRSLIEKFPQRFATKADITTLPNAKRRAWVRQQAQNLMDQFGNYDAALLLAYLGYQTSDAQLLQYGLDMTQQHLQGDPLLPLIRHAWQGK